MYSQLGGVRVVVKDGVVFDEADKTIKGLWLSVKFVVKAFRAVKSPVI